MQRILNDVRVIDYDRNMNFDFIKDIPSVPKVRGNHGGKKYHDTVNITCAFDIETTQIEEINQSIMYVWQFAIGEDICIIGRTWSQFLEMLKKLKNECEGRNMIAYIFNASFEFQFIKGIYKFTNDEVFALDDRKILYFRMFDFIEFRCAYIHTNESLDRFLKSMDVKHKKIDGDAFDYSKKRYPWTPIESEIELSYIVNDVIGLVEAINIEMKHTDDTLNTLVYTKTGFVRRDAKRVMQGASHEMIVDCQPSFHVYELLRRAFRGGDTHANRYYTGIIVPNVGSHDRSSSYPDVICNCVFPITAFKEVVEPDVDKLVYHLKRKRACLMNISLQDVKLKDSMNGMPYLPKAKCEGIIKGEYDNGRILSAEYIDSFVCTDIDLRIMVKEYEFEMIVNELYYAKYGYLPEQLRALNVEYYRQKTELKNVKGQEFEYLMAKSQLNSIYGFMAQNPLKRTLNFDGYVFNEDMTLTDEELLKKLLKKAFVSYAWGVFTTSWARYRLRQMIWELPVENVLYVDTDSVKYIGDADFSKYNKSRIKDSKIHDAYAKDKHGEIHYMGVAEFEGRSDFVTLGAKKYCTLKNGKLTTTIAGVSKRYGGEELGSIENFKEGFTFYKAGGTESIYNDFPFGKYEIEGHEIDITSNIVIKESTYTLGVTQEYRNLIRCAQFDAFNKIVGDK